MPRWNKRPSIYKYFALYTFLKMTKNEENNESIIQTSFEKTIFCVQTIFRKVDLICHLRPRPCVENHRTLILSLSGFHQKLDFDLVFTI